MKALAALSVLYCRLALGACPVVTSSADDGAGSLRDCINAANGAATRQTLTFDPFTFPAPTTIVLASELPPLNAIEGVEIDGADRVVIDGSGLVDAAGLKLFGSKNVLTHLTVQGLNGSGFGSGAGVYLLVGSKENVLDHLNLLDNKGEGVMLDGDNGGTQITNNTISNCGGCGVMFNGTASACTGRVTIAHNSVSTTGAALDCGGIHLIGGSCVDVDDNQLTATETIAIKLSADVFDVNVTRNHIFQVGTNGIGVFGGAHDNFIAWNIVDGALDEGIAVGDTGSINNRLIGNIVAHTAFGLNTRGWGIHVYAGSDGAQVFHNAAIENAGDGVVIENSPVLRMQNNLSIGNGGFGFSGTAQAGVTFDHNLSALNVGGGFASGGPGPTDLTCDPQLVLDADAGYLPPMCSSCAVNAGLDLGVAQPDLTGPADSVTFYGTAPDLGARESGCGAPLDAGTPMDAGTASDAGSTPDAGNDAGQSPPRALAIGCGCEAAPSSVLIGVALLALARRRPRRTAA